MASKPVIFISAVSKELRSTRDLVAKVLLSLGYDPVWQDLFGLEDGTVKEMLRRKIDASDGLIQLVGHSYGAESQTPDADFGRVSYTQYEALYARQQKKRVWYLILEDTFPADAHEPEIEEQQQLQLAYRQRLQSEDHLFHNLVSGTDIELRLMKLRDELSHLRRKGKQWAALVLALLVVLVLGIVWLKRDLWQQTQANSETKAAVTKLQDQNDKLLQALRELPQTLSQQAQTGQKEDEATRIARAYATLETQLHLPQGSLAKELPVFAEHLLLQADTSAMDRANALFATKKFAEAEAAALQAKDKALAAAGQPVQDAIAALQLAGQSAQAQIHYAQAMEHYRAAAALTSQERDVLPWPACAPLAHRSTLTSQERDVLPWLDLQNAISHLYYLQGRYPEGLTHAKQVWQIAQQAGKDDAPAVLTAHMRYALALDNNGQAAAAVPEYRAVIQVQERVLGAEHPETLSSRMGLANALQSQGKHAEAEQEYRAVLKIKEGVLGVEHPSTLRSRMGVANTLWSRAKYAEAEQEYRSVLKVMERVLGAEHPETLSSRMGLAIALQSQGKHAEAEQEHRAVLKLRERVLGAEHPDTLKSRNNLAIALQSQGKNAEAEQEHRAVLKIKERVLGAEHPDVARSCYNLALCIKAQQKLPEALAFMQRAEQVWTKALGPDHPDTKDANRERERIEAALKAK